MSIRLAETDTVDWLARRGRDDAVGADAPPGTDRELSTDLLEWNDCSLVDCLFIPDRPLVNASIE